jgi:hypothetical protein
LPKEPGSSILAGIPGWLDKFGIAAQIADDPKQGEKYAYRLLTNREEESNIV